MNKLFFILSTITALSVGVSCTSGKSEEVEKGSKGLALRVHRVEVSDATTVKNYIGTIEGKVNVEIRPQVEGILQEIFVDEGAYVEAGQPLFKVDGSAYVEVLNNHEATRNVAKAKLQKAKLEIDRLKPLVDNEVISAVRLQAAESDYDVAKALLDQANAVVRSAEINQRFTTITAPVGGYIGRIPKRIGNLITKGDKDPLTVLSDVHEVYVYFSMNESDFLYFTKQKAKQDSILGIKNDRGSFPFPDATLILADGEAYNQTGRVDAVNGQVDRTTGAISLRASFPNTENILRSGSTGTLKIEEIKKDVLLIPQVATMELQDKTFVYVLDAQNKVRRRAITIGGKSKNNYIVSAGIAAGERVLLSGLDKITDGSDIIPLEK